MTECAVCGARQVRQDYPALGIAPSDPKFVLLRCPDCGLGWTSPVTPDSEIGKWYPPSYYGKDNVRFNIFFELMVRLFRQRRARMISRLTAPGPVLDVGCGRGFTLQMLRAKGFDPYGVELNETAAWHAREQLKINVHAGDFLKAPYAPNFFSAIIFWHSLEHFRLPVEAVRHAHKLLKPGGLLVIAVPNSESLQARWFGPHWFHLDIPRHYFHFGTKSLGLLLTQCGFQVAETVHFSAEQNPYGWLQTIYNKTGMEFNLLYSILKNRTARNVSIRQHPIQVIIILATLPAFLAFSLAMTILETVLQRGGTVEVYAIKNKPPTH